MKSLLNSLVLLITLNVFSQKLTCCSTLDEVKKVLQGDWKLLNEQEIITYRFSFLNEKGIIEVLQELNLPPKAEKTVGNEPDINEQISFAVTLNNGVFFIEMAYFHAKVTEQILELTATNFSYGTKEEQHVFVRDKI